MEEHPIENLMKTAMESIQKMIHVNTVIGDPVETPGGAVIIPVSKVSCGFAAGGSEFKSIDDQVEEKEKNNEENSKMPFGGGSGAGVSVKPVGFLVVSQDQVRLLPVEGNMVAERLIDEIPTYIDKLSHIINKRKPSRESSDELF